MIDGKYLFFSKKRQDRVLAYMKESSQYSMNEINSLYESSQSKEISHFILLGYLIQNESNQVNQKKLIDLSKNESEFRDHLVDQYKASSNNKIKRILKENNISLVNIKNQEISFEASNLNPYRFMRLAIEKKDLKIIDILEKSEKKDDKE